MRFDAIISGYCGRVVLNHIRRGSGRPLLLVHGLGSNHGTWSTIIEQLAAQREVIALDLPGFGASPPLTGRPTIAAFCDALAGFQSAHGLEGADLVGSSMGARIVLELARRGATGSTVSLDPGGFWSPHQVRIFRTSLAVSIQLVRFLRPALPTLMRSAAGRTALLAQFSARPWAVPASVATAELESLAASEQFDRVLRELVEGPTQAGADSTPGSITIGWGRQDRVCFPSQAKLAQERFPQAKLHWFERCGHFPHWDVPAETVNLILSSTAR